MRTHSDLDRAPMPSNHRRERVEGRVRSGVGAGFPSVKEARSAERHAVEKAPQIGFALARGTSPLECIDGDRNTCIGAHRSIANEGHHLDISEPFVRRRWLEITSHA